MNFAWIIALSIVLLASVTIGGMALWRRTRFS
jgi:hypothetical protein